MIIESEISEQGSLITPHRITVLLIDDQAIVGEAVKTMLLDEQDIDFHYCQNPLEAIKMADRVSPTVILQDLVMPEIDGLTLLRYFRANDATRHVPLIVLSSKEEAHTKAEAFALGANDYMVKFPEQLEVIARIRHHSGGYINWLERNEVMTQLEKAYHFIRKTFGRYLSDDVVDSILESPEGLKLGGEKRTVTIMITDLRGFTAISERFPAEDVVNIINIYLEVMTDIVFKYKGTINALIGDSIVVVFGALILRDDDAQRAVACALEMQLFMDEVNQRCRNKGYPAISQGIGINTGEVVVGNIGSKKRIKYDVIGYHVNVASRVESYTVGGQVFISENTLQACTAELTVNDQIEVMPKGMHEPITIYNVRGIGDKFNLLLPVEKKITFYKLKTPLPVRLAILKGKDTGIGNYEGDLVKLAGTMAEVRASRNFRMLTDLKLTLDDGAGQTITTDLYAKVTKTLSETPPVFIFTFTSIPREASIFFKKLLA